MKAMNRIRKFISYIFGADLMQMLVEENLRGNAAPLSMYLQCTNTVTNCH